jgi:hypothetical protein
MMVVYKRKAFHVYIKTKAYTLTHTQQQIPHLKQKHTSPRTFKPPQSNHRIPPLHPSASRSSLYLRKTIHPGLWEREETYLNKKTPTLSSKGSPISQTPTAQTSLTKTEPTNYRYINLTESATLAIQTQVLYLRRSS